VLKICQRLYFLTPVQDMFAAVGVCKAWRSTGFQQFFLSPWASASEIVHPLQLLSLVRDCYMYCLAVGLQTVWHWALPDRDGLADAFAAVRPSANSAPATPAARSVTAAQVFLDITMTPA